MKSEIPDKPESEHFLCTPTVSASPPTKSRRHCAHICIGRTNNDQSRHSLTLSRLLKADGKRK
jgi:hypothetical protein